MKTFNNEQGKIIYYDREELTDSVIIVDGICFHYDRDEIDIENKEVKRQIPLVVKQAKKEGFNNYTIAKDPIQGIYMY